MAARAAIGKTAAMNGMRGFEGRGASSTQILSVG
jgi:hypothetical protein